MHMPGSRIGNNSRAAIILGPRRIMMAICIRAGGEDVVLIEW